MRAPPYLLHHILDAGPAAPSTAAVIDGERTLTYGDFVAASGRCADSLRRAGLQRGDRVVIVLPKSIEECWAIFGTSRAGGVFVPVNTLLRGPQIRHIAADSGARIVITSRALRDGIAAALDGLDHVAILVAPDLLGNGDDATGGHAATRGEPDPCIGEDLAAILYTSGSTGMPKRSRA